MQSKFEELRLSGLSEETHGGQFERVNQETPYQQANISAVLSANNRTSYVLQCLLVCIASHFGKQSVDDQTDQSSHEIAN